MSNELYIIGNGFDLSHGMKTSWGDFLEWLAYKKEFSLLCNWLTFYPGFSEKLWSNLEQALGEYDIEDQYEYCTHDIEIDYDHMMRSGFGIEDSPMVELSPITSQLQSSLSGWIQSIPLPSQEKQCLPKDARFLSFNYTSVLEHAYRIPQQQVFHIHGCSENNDMLIFGHNNYISEASSSDPDQIIFIENAKAAIVNIMNELYKDVLNIIEANSAYFAELSDIAHITVLGHSYNNIDMPYFKAIAAHVESGCQWFLGYHTDTDKRAAENAMAAIGILQSQYKLFQT